MAAPTTTNTEHMVMPKMGIPFMVTHYRICRGTSNELPDRIKGWFQLSYRLIIIRFIIHFQVATSVIKLF